MKKQFSNSANAEPDQNMLVYVAMPMTMTTVASDVMFSIAGTGKILIDWGDGIKKIYLLSAKSVYTHHYSDASSHTITLKGGNITGLSCFNNQLTALDVSKNIALQSLYCGRNQLASLDVSKNGALTDLDCGSNLLTTVDVSKNIMLQWLTCIDNQLTTLDVSKNCALTNLWCSRNQLTALDVSRNIALTELFCSTNQLTSLDLTNNTALKDYGYHPYIAVYCYSNRLTGPALNALFGTLHGNDEPKTIYIYDNPGIADCDPSIAINKGWAVDTVSTFW